MLSNTLSLDEEEAVEEELQALQAEIVSRSSFLRHLAQTLSSFGKPKQRKYTCQTYLRRDPSRPFKYKACQSVLSCHLMLTVHQRNEYSIRTKAERQYPQHRFHYTYALKLV